MINSLTPEQEAKIPEYLAEFLKLGISTTPCNRAEAESAISDSYDFLGLKRPTQFLWVDSPKEGAIAAYMVENRKDLAKTKKIPAKVLKNLSSQTISASRGSHESFWVSFYCFINEVLDVKKTVGADIARRIVTNCGWYWTFENLVIISEKPTSLNFNADQRLHKETGPAILYKDGFAVYSLNGVRMPSWIFDVPKENLSSKKILALENAEQRMQAMKLKGLGHFFSELSTKEIDAEGDYKLLLVDLFGEQCEFLKMVNPSTGEIHLEGVPPGTKSVDEARAWRNALTYWVNPTALT